MIPKLTNLVARIEREVLLLVMNWTPSQTNWREWWTLYKPPRNAILSCLKAGSCYRAICQTLSEKKIELGKSTDGADPDTQKWPLTFVDLIHEILPRESRVGIFPSPPRCTTEHSARSSATPPAHRFLGGAPASTSLGHYFLQQELRLCDVFEFQEFMTSGGPF